MVASLTLFVSFLALLVVKCQNMNNDSGTDNNCLTSALIPYVEAKVPNLFKPERIFTFNNTQLVIQQDWTNLGVAGVVWDAAIVLARHLENESLKGLKVIELGAGTGILSIVLASLGAETTATDLKECLPLIRTNIQRNFVDSKRITVKELVWGHNLDRFARDYDLIVGADIVYVEETFGDLISTLRRLSRNESKIYLSSKIRYEKDRTFFDRLSQFFIINEVSYDAQTDVHIHAITKKCDLSF